MTALAGSEGTDTLEQIERLQFADRSLAFDLDGHAGITAKFLAAVFGQESLGNTRYVGIGLDLLDGGMSQGSLMQLALDSRLGQGFSAEAEVVLLYQNLIGRGPTALELQFWTGALAEGLYTMVSLGLMAAQHDLNLIHVDLVGLAHSGLEFS